MTKAKPKKQPIRRHSEQQATVEKRPSKGNPVVLVPPKKKTP